MRDLNEGDWCVIKCWFNDFAFLAGTNGGGIGITGRQVSIKSIDFTGCGFLIFREDVGTGGVGVDDALSAGTRASSIMEISLPAPERNSGLSLSRSDLTEASSSSVE